MNSLRGSLSQLDSRLASLRTDSTQRRWALLGAVLSGVLLAWVHWAGLIIAGALVGLTRRRGRWAVVSGLGFGLLMLLITTFVSPLSATEMTALTPINHLTIATGLFLPAWGALTRYLI